MQRAICCRIFTPAARPEYPAASLRDYCCGVLTTLRRHIGDLEASTKARFDATPKNGKARRFKGFSAGGRSWSRVERIIARVEAGADGTDTRFIVTNLDTRNAR